MKNAIPNRKNGMKAEMAMVCTMAGPIKVYHPSLKSLCSLRIGIQGKGVEWKFADANKKTTPVFRNCTIKIVVMFSLLV